MFPKQFTKAAVKYTDTHGDSPEQCSKCRHYINRTTCEIVAGRINPDGWCKKFEKRASEPSHKTSSEYSE